MNTNLDEYFAERYAFGKLTEFVATLFTGLEPARVRLSENLHYLSIISPTDFRQQKHQNLWRELQRKLVGKTKNVGLKRAPVHRLTVQNNTLEFSLNAIWSIYEECLLIHRHN